MVAKEKDQFIKLTGVLNAYTIRDIEAELNSYLEKATDILKIDINSILKSIYLQHSRFIL